MKRHLSISLFLLALTACSDSGLTGVDGAGTANASRQAAELDMNRPQNAAGSLTVMTRNMYVGTDVDAVIAAEDPNQIPFIVADVWELLLATNFPERARALAAEIARERPHLVGLQEVSLLRTQFPADFVVNAQDVAFDYITTLLEELSLQGADYRIVAIVQDSDVEVPRLNSDFTLTDVRLTDFDVVLAREDVQVSNVTAQNFAAFVPVPGTDIQILRGWTALDATVKGQTYHFVNTHLEPVETGGGLFQSLQAQELIDALASQTLPLILVGDLNSEAVSGATYNLLQAAGYTDAWTLQSGQSSDGFTCCHDLDLLNEESGLYKRIDHIMLRNVDDLWPSSGPTPVQAGVVGDDVRHKTESGLWPSDHAGVVARLQFPRP